MWHHMASSEQCPVNKSDHCRFEGLRTAMSFLCSLPLMRQSWMSCVGITINEMVRYDQVRALADSGTMPSANFCWMQSVSNRLCLSCYNKYQGPGDLNNKHLFLIVPEAGMFMIKMPADSASGEESILDLQMIIFLLYPHLVEREIASLVSLLVRAVILFMRALPSWPNFLPKTSHHIGD